MSQYYIYIYIRECIILQDMYVPILTLSSIFEHYYTFDRYLKRPDILEIVSIFHFGQSYFSSPPPPANVYTISDRESLRWNGVRGRQRLWSVAAIVEGIMDSQWDGHVSLPEARGPICCRPSVCFFKAAYTAGLSEPGPIIACYLWPCVVRQIFMPAISAYGAPTTAFNGVILQQTPRPSAL